jgi:hypothetical protein
MKRSEAVDLLFNILKDSPVSTKYFNKEEVEGLLQEIENKIGMKPPEVSYYDNCENCHRAWCFWEEE